MRRIMLNKSVKLKNSSVNTVTPGLTEPKERKKPSDICTAHAIIGRRKI